MYSGCLSGRCQWLMCMDILMSLSLVMTFKKELWEIFVSTLSASCVRVARLFD